MAISPRQFVALRRASQGLFLAVLAGSFALAPFSDPASALSGFVARFSPTLALSAMLAHQALLVAFWPSLLLLLSGLLLGRGFCGWACPVGSLLDATDAVIGRFRRIREDGAGRFLWLPLGILATVLALSALGTPLAGWLDPLSLFSRTLATGIVPLSDDVPVPEAAAPLGILAVLACILALDLVRRRFFCRYLCPTGGLLSVVARLSPLRFAVGRASCGSCARCATDCRTGAIAPSPLAASGSVPGANRRGGDTDMSRCVLCMSCLGTCDSRSIGFAPRLAMAGSETPRVPPRPDRRAFLAGVGAGIAAGSVLGRLDPAPPPLPRIRPPGAGDEDRFLDLCLRCGTCVQACPTAGLAPLPLSAGIEALWTPVLVSRKGHCDWTCHRCAEACPSGAIELLPPEKRQRAIIGIAVLDRRHCLPWASGTPCAVCMKICPVQPRAIELSDLPGAGVDPGRFPGTPPLPRVLADKCVGCGLCERVCPVPGPGAIIVREVGA